MFRTTISKLAPKRRSPALVLLVIAAVLLLSVATPLFDPSTRFLYLIIGIIVGTLGIIVLIKDLQFGLAVFIFASLFVPFGLRTGTYTNLDASLLILFLLVGSSALAALVQGNAIFPRSRTVLPLAAFLVVSVASLFVGQLPWLDFAQGAPLRAQLGGLTAIVISGLTFLLVGRRVRSLTWLKRLTWLFIGLGGVIVIGRFVPILGPLVGRFVAPGATGSLFWIWFVALAFGQAAFNSDLTRGRRLLLGGLVVIVFYENLFHGTRWASGWIPPLITAIVILWMGAPRIGLAATLVGGLGALANLERVASFVMVGDNQYSLLTRLEAWRILGEVIKVSPILGLGPANYYWYVPLFPILGYSVPFSSHNNYVDIVAQTGLLGLACFLWFVWALGRLGWNLLSRVPEGFERAYVFAGLGGLVGTLAAGMLGDWIIPFVYNTRLAGLRASLMAWLFLGGLLVLDRLSASSLSGGELTNGA